ncbi:MAG: hypothetical protein IJN75_06535 [Clostridia bacterium]|nr:hypothetical protein [Clostridia bacterium]
MINNKLKLIITLLILTSMLLASCVPNNTTSTTDNSIISDIESKNDNSVDNSTDESAPDESTPFSEPENSDVDTSEESTPETSDVSAAEESDDYSDIVVEAGYVPEGTDRIFYQYKVFDLYVLGEAIGDDALWDTVSKIQADPYYYYYELQWPDLYACIKLSGVTKEAFEKSNAELGHRYTQEEIELLFSDDVELLKKTFKLKVAFYYEGKLFTLQDVCKIIVDLAETDAYLKKYNKDGALVEYLQYMERALKSGKFVDVFSNVNLYLNLIDSALSQLTE